MSQINPPPTYAEVIVEDEKTKRSTFNPIWLKWFLDIAAYVSANGGSGGTVNHESLAGLQGGAGGEHQHFTVAEHTALTAGFTGTGNLVRASGATLTNPAMTGATNTDTPSTGDVAAMTKSSVALNNGAAAAAGTLLNAPAAGNPTKWIPILDNGVTRYIPAW